MKSPTQLLFYLLVFFLLQGCADELAVSEESLASKQQLTPKRVEGSERMARRLATLAENASLQHYVFQNEERLAWMRAQPLAEDPVEAVRAKLDLANELLRAGSSEDAVNTFAELLRDIETHPDKHPPNLARRVRSLLAVAYLRLGEQENCLHQHNLDACLLPIRDGGLHQQQRGSRAALGELEGLLEDNPDDLGSLWLYNLAAMTLGEYPEGVPPAWRVPETAFDSEDDIGRFFDIAPRTGLATVGLAGGSVVDDLDGDGRLDVLVSSWGLRDPLRFFHQTADQPLRFEEREAGLDGLVGGLNLIHADHDNDGDLDILVLRGAWMREHGRHPNSLLRNDGQGHFEDVTEAAGLLSFHPTQTASWGDFDNDGWLDLYIGNESAPGAFHPCELYRNNGPDGAGQVTFTNVARETGVEAGGLVKGVAWGDFDNDGWLDLYLSRMRQTNLLFRNLGPGADGLPRFEEVSTRAGVGEPRNSFPTWFFDFDNDGWLDLFAGGYGQTFLDARETQAVAFYLGKMSEHLETSHLYRNNRDGTFTDISDTAGLAEPMLAMGANFGDLDNDGWLDLYIGTGAPDFRALVPNRMFRNDEGERFLDITTSSGTGHLQKGHAVSFADLDADGDQDLFSVIGGAFSGDVYQNVLFENPGHGNRWITLVLEGTKSNRSAIGARLQLRVVTASGERQIHAAVSSGGSFGASSLRQEIGLGKAQRLAEVAVLWPGGEEQLFVDLPLDSLVFLRQGEAAFRVE